jgi:hypothetical protein
MENELNGLVRWFDINMTTEKIILVTDINADTAESLTHCEPVIKLRKH